ncbi:MAG: HutD family protein [Actinobacteria bacterium]|nr:HutD family protein [Actinomycetota bacterium]
MRVQRFGEHRAMPWANGLGTSYEVASDRSVDGVWTWRVAIAPVVLDGPFSVMPGVDRELVVIEGNGMVLEVDGESVECLSAQVARFSGDSTTFARLVDGPVVDLGLMTVRGSITGIMVVVVDGGDVVESDVLVAIGDAVFEDENGRQYRLGIKDALLNVSGHQLVLLGGMAIAIQVNS